MTDKVHELDRFLDVMEIRVEAFGICEIGHNHALRCEPAASVVVHFVLAGAGYLSCEHGQYALSEGTAVVVPRMLPKLLSGAGPIEQVAAANATCTVEGDVMRFRACDGVPGLVLGCAELSSTAGSDFPLFDRMTRPIIEHSRAPPLKGLFKNMLDELQNPRVGTRALVGALMKQVLIVMLRSQPNDESLRLLMTSAPLAGAIAAILERPEENHTVESLAAMVGMSRSCFSQHFTTAYDLSPRAFVQTARLACAARMLSGSSLPVKSVAASVGYASRSHFSRAFQAKFGVDPTTFRKSSEASCRGPHPAPGYRG